MSQPASSPCGQPFSIKTEKGEEIYYKNSLPKKEP